MKKLTHKAFTLVELIIVVVIIGILAAALLPRLQGAQGSARDAARKSDISQLGSAIVSYQANRGYFPLAGGSGDDAANGTMVSAALLWSGLSTVVDLSSMPADPLKANQFTGTTAGTEKFITGGQYAYAVMKKNEVPKGGFIVMARVETEGGANWVHSGGLNVSTADITSLKPCTSVTKGGTGTSNDGNGKCTYENKADLRYLYIF